jgi:hypothetical protein
MALRYEAYAHWLLSASTHTPYHHTLVHPTPSFLTPSFLPLLSQARLRQDKNQIAARMQQVANDAEAAQTSALSRLFSGIMKSYEVPSDLPSGRYTLQHTSEARAWLSDRSGTFPWLGIPLTHAQTGRLLLAAVC